MKWPLKNVSWAPPTFGCVPPRIAWWRVPYPVLLWRYWFCNFLTWFTMKTDFERDCKSHRRVLAWLIQGEIPLTLVSFEFLFRETVRVILLWQFVHLYALLLGPANWELWFTIDSVSEKTRDRECIQSLFVKLSFGFAFNQELPAGAVDNSLIPIEKTLRTLHFRYSFAQLE